jgi:hypothetical protein
MRYLLTFLFFILLVSNTYAFVENDEYVKYSSHPVECKIVIEAHAVFDLNGIRYKGNWKTHRVIGFIAGYMTAVNRLKAGKSDWFRGKNAMQLMDWVASYCRSNPEDELHDALNQYQKPFSDFLPTK